MKKLLIILIFVLFIDTLPRDNPPVYADTVDTMIIGEGLLLLHYGTGKTYYGLDDNGYNVYYKQEDTPIMKWVGRGFIVLGLIGLINGN